MEEKKYRLEIKRYTPLLTPVTECKYVDIDMPDDIIEKILEATNSEDIVANRILADIRIFKN